MPKGKKAEALEGWYATTGRDHERRFMAALVIANDIAKRMRTKLGEREIGNIMKLMHSVDLTENVVTGTHKTARKKRRA